MPTLQELMEKDFGIGDQVKTASVNSSDDLDSLAAALGFDFGKTGEEEGSKEDEKEDEKEDKEEKEASVSLGGLYNELFPEDGMLSKTAEEQEKIAYEQNLGARAYDAFASRWDRRVEKLAADVLSGSATVSGSTAADHDGNPHGDTTPPQAQKSNKPANASDKIDTSPVITDEVKALNDKRTVGDYEQKSAAIKSAALRKAWLLSQLDD